MVEVAMQTIKQIEEWLLGREVVLLHPDEWSEKYADRYRIGVDYLASYPADTSSLDALFTSGRRPPQWDETSHLEYIWVDGRGQYCDIWQGLGAQVLPHPSTVWPMNLYSNNPGILIYAIDKLLTFEILKLEVEGFDLAKLDDDEQRYVKDTLLMKGRLSFPEVKP
jgi:hypothetical protein